MALGTGLGGSVGIAAESTYGTWVAPTRWVEVRSDKMQENVKIVQGTGLANGRIVDLGSRRSKIWADAKGTMELEFLNSGMALLLANAMGSSATLTQNGTTAAYTITCNLGAQDNQNYFSMQELVPDVAGTKWQQNFHGCKIQKVTWTADTQNPLMWALDIDSQQVTTAEGAGTPSYTTTTRNFTMNGMNLKVGAFGSEATVDGVKKLTCTVERGLADARMYLGQTVKAEPLTNAVVKISGSADVDLTAANKPILWDLYHSQAAVPSIVLDFVGSAIGTSGKNDELLLNITNAFIDSGGTPELDGTDVTMATLNFSGTIDAANDSAFSAKLTTADTTF